MERASSLGASIFPDVCPLYCDTNALHTQMEELYALVNTTIVAANMIEVDLD